MDTATGIIPEGFFRPDSKNEVMTLLLGMALPGKTKARILKDWAKWTGAKLEAADLDQVERSGVEAAPVVKLPGE